MEASEPKSPHLSHELEEYNLDALRDEAQIKRFEAGIEAEEIKELAVNVLRKAVASRDVRNNMLLRIIVSLSKSTEGVLKELEQQAGKQRRRKRAGARHSAKQPLLR
jgi:undecaprenyl pyrophosphate synthase